MNTEQLRFEAYSDLYFDSCVELIRSTWNFHSEFVGIPDETAVYQYYLKTCLNWNHHLELIVDADTQVKGILFGSKEEISYLEELSFARRDKRINKWKNQMLKNGGFGEITTAKQNLSRFVMNDFLGEEDACLFGGEVNLFIVSPELRGKGLGKQLMNRYLSFCKQNKVKSIFLWTDKDCNHNFYSRFGFRLHKRFRTYTGYQQQSEVENGMVFSLAVE